MIFENRQYFLRIFTDPKNVFSHASQGFRRIVQTVYYRQYRYIATLPASSFKALPLFYVAALNAFSWKTKLNFFREASEYLCAVQTETDPERPPLRSDALICERRVYTLLHCPPPTLIKAVLNVSGGGGYSL